MFGKSDPYYVVKRFRRGTEEVAFEFTSSVIKSNLNPVWEPAYWDFSEVRSFPDPFCLVCICIDTYLMFPDVFTRHVSHVSHKTRVSCLVCICIDTCLMSPHVFVSCLRLLSHVTQDLGVSVCVELFCCTSHRLTERE